MGIFQTYQRCCMCITCYRSNPCVQNHYVRGHLCKNPVLRFLDVSPRSKTQFFHPTIFLGLLILSTWEQTRDTVCSHRSAKKLHVDFTVWVQSISPEKITIGLLVSKHNFRFCAVAQRLKKAERSPGCSSLSFCFPQCMCIWSWRKTWETAYASKSHQITPHVRSVSAKSTCMFKTTMKTTYVLKIIRFYCHMVRKLKSLHRRQMDSLPFCFSQRLSSISPKYLNEHLISENATNEDACVFVAAILTNIRSYRRMWPRCAAEPLKSPHRRIIWFLYLSVSLEDFRKSSQNASHELTV
jgi:hypothetical protein